MCLVLIRNIIAQILLNTVATDLEFAQRVTINDFLCATMQPQSSVIMTVTTFILSHKQTMIDKIMSI